MQNALLTTVNNLLSVTLSKGMYEYVKPTSTQQAAYSLESVRTHSSRVDALVLAHYPTTTSRKRLSANLFLQTSTFEPDCQTRAGK